MTHFFMSIITWYMDHISYWTVALLMAIESSFLPLPSELVIPPAAWKAASGQMSPLGIILAGTIGALCGALFNYSLAITLGRKILYKLVDTKLAHMILLSRAKLEKAEAYFNKHGKSSTLIGRLVPVVRHLISIPAGLSRMNMKYFLLYTFIGAGLWNIILLILGYALYSQRDLLENYYQLISYAFLGLGALFVIFLILKSRLTKQSKPSFISSNENQSEQQTRIETK